MKSVESEAKKKPAASEWRDMESAPKNGETVFLLILEPVFVIQSASHWGDKWHCNCLDGCALCGEPVAWAAIDDDALFDVLEEKKKEKRGLEPL